MKNKVPRGLTVPSFIPLLLSAISAGAQTPAPSGAEPVAAGGAVHVEVYKAPELAHTTIVHYPRGEAASGAEGWVELNMMIDPTGKPYEVAVLNSSGNKAFEKTAIRAVTTQYTFRPAMLDDKPVDASMTFKIKFSLTDPDHGARPLFVNAYKRLKKALADNDRGAADAELAKLRVHNLYEDAFRNIGLYEYHAKWGTEWEQMAYLSRAIAGESKPGYLPREVFVSVAGALMKLELKTQRYGEALRTWEILRPLLSKDVAAKMQATVDQVLALRAASGAIKTSARIDAGASWYGSLFKRQFQIAVSKGHVSEIKLRCEKKYVFFRFEPDLLYKVESRHGDCGIQVIGDPETTFELIQL